MELLIYQSVHFLHAQGSGAQENIEGGDGVRGGERCRGGGAGAAQAGVASGQILITDVNMLVVLVELVE